MDKHFMVGCVPSLSDNNLGLGARCLLYFYPFKVKNLFIYLVRLKIWTGGCSQMGYTADVREPAIRSIS